MAGRCADGETMAGIYAANQSRGLRSPCTLRQGHCPCTHQGHCPWTHFAKNLSYRPIVIPHVNRENEKKQNYGHNENNQKKTGEKATSFLLRLFLCFPRMLCIRWTAFCRRARGCQWHLQLAKLQSFFAKEFLRVSWREDDNPSGPAGQLSFHKGSAGDSFCRNCLQETNGRCC